MALLLDLEKAYDRVDHNFLFRAEAKMGIPEEWVRLPEAIYSVSTSAILVNGIKSEFFSLGRGVRQACLLSPLLFLMAIEPLACLVRQHPDLRGLELSCVRR